MIVSPGDRLLELASGAVLVCALVALWRRDLRATVRVLALQGIALGAVVATLAAQRRDATLGATALVVLAEKALVIPVLLDRAVRNDPSGRESAPLVNVPSSLVAAGGLTVLAFGALAPLGALAPDPSGRLAPIGVATLLIGLLVLVTRRKAVSQIVGIVLLDNGIALAAFLLTGGVPLLVELGVSLDVLLAVVVARVLSAQMHAQFGALDLDQLRELRDS